MYLNKKENTRIINRKIDTLFHAFAPFCIDEDLPFARHFEGRWEKETSAKYSKVNMRRQTGKSRVWKVLNWRNVLEKPLKIPISI